MAARWAHTPCEQITALSNTGDPIHYTCRYWHVYCTIHNCDDLSALGALCWFQIAAAESSADVKQHQRFQLWQHEQQLCTSTQLHPEPVLGNDASTPWLDSARGSWLEAINSVDKTQLTQQVH
jgi:hypothetical protein